MVARVDIMSTSQEDHLLNRWDVPSPFLYAIPPSSILCLFAFFFLSTIRVFPLTLLLFFLLRFLHSSFSPSLIFAFHFFHHYICFRSLLLTSPYSLHLTPLSSTPPFPPLSLSPRLSPVSSLLPLLPPFSSASFLPYNLHNYPSPPPPYPFPPYPCLPLLLPSLPPSSCPNPHCYPALPHTPINLPPPRIFPSSLPHFPSWGPLLSSHLPFLSFNILPFYLPACRSLLHSSIPLPSSTQPPPAFPPLPPPTLLNPCLVLPHPFLSLLYPHSLPSLRSSPQIPPLYPLIPPFSPPPHYHHRAPSPLSALYPLTPPFSPLSSLPSKVSYSTSASPPSLLLSPSPRPRSLLSLSPASTPFPLPLWPSPSFPLCPFPSPSFPLLPPLSSAAFPAPPLPPLPAASSCPLSPSSSSLPPLLFPPSRAPPARTRSKSSGGRPRPRSRVVAAVVEGKL
ncbi:hypothetical protein C7M84_013036 [Penaeus vannamei]|uniref:Uncharacterized protein n=1 Tax=Penaeus vannamei TaxID=6689 RepID=A0A3R7Q532_PENVA|nr:hypothetical protein C7M84_013036 [Penaeus vannamei]